MEKCPLCEEYLEREKEFSFNGYSVLQCRSCRARISLPAVRTRYNAELVRFLLPYLDQFEIPARLGKYLEVKGKRILDIGCGTGCFLEQMKGNEVLGIEFSDSYRQYLIKRNIPYIIGDIESCAQNLKDSYFDIITMWDVLEHLKRPQHVLIELRKKLQDSGKIIIWTSNYEEIISIVSEIAYLMSLGRCTSLIEKCFDRELGHNYNFCKESLHKLCMRTGYQVLDFFYTDTQVKRLPDVHPGVKIFLPVFYLVNRIMSKGKIICYIIGKK